MRREAEQIRREERRFRRCKIMTNQLEALRQNQPSIKEAIWYPEPGFLLSLGQALMGNTHLRNLDLLDIRFSEADARALSAGIGQAKLESLDISCPVQVPSERIWATLCQGIQASQTIQKLSFSDVPIDALVGLGDALPLMPSLRTLSVERLFLTKPGAQALARGIGHSKLQRLELTHCIWEQTDEAGIFWLTLHLGIQASQAIQELSFKYIPAEYLVGSSDVLLSCQSLEFACSHKDNLSWAELISNVLMRSTSLKKLDLTFCITQVAQGLTRNVSVTSVMPSVYELCDRALAALLAQGLRWNAPITDLNLSHCQISNVGVGIMLEYLHQQNSHIQRLSLEYNKIGPAGAELLFSAFEDHPMIERLSLQGNFDIGYVGLQIIGDVLANQKLTHVNLVWCQERSPPADKSSHMAKSLEKARIRAGQALLEGMQRNSHIQDIRLDAMVFSQDFLNTIEFYANLNRNGRYLLSSHHGLAATVWCFVFAKWGQSHPQFGASSVFYLLLEEPTLVQPSTSFGKHHPYK